METILNVLRNQISVSILNALSKKDAFSPSVFANSVDGTKVEKI